MYFLLSSIPEATPAYEMLEALHEDRHKSRPKPCVSARGDSYRMFWYDVTSAADFSDHSVPLLVRRHNVVPGMFLVGTATSFRFVESELKLNSLSWSAFL